MIKIIIFSRSKDKLLKTLTTTIDSFENKIEIFEVDLLDLKINLDITKKYYLKVIFREFFG